jgi:hypothetical protein
MNVPPYALWGLFIAFVIPAVLYFMKVSRDNHTAAVTAKKERDDKDAAAKKERNVVASAFVACVDKWLDDINDRQQIALAGIRFKSIPEIEPVMRAARAHLNDSSKSNFDEEWKKYKSISRDQLEGKKAIQPETGSAIILYDEPRKILSEPLKKMKEMATAT